MANERRDGMTPEGTQEHSRYINRHLSWLQFNRRVLEEGQDESVPLLERTKFFIHRFYESG